MEAARKKAAVISNDIRTASAVRTSLRGLGGPCLSRARSLGLEFATAKPIASRIRPVSKQRLQAYKKKGGAGGVIGMIQDLFDDSKKLEAEAAQDEKDAQAALRGVLSSSGAN